MSGGNTPATITIYVSRIGNSDNLSLKQGTSTPGQPGDPGDDTLVTDVVANQPIEWKVDTNPDSGRNNDITLVHVKAADSSVSKYSNSQQLLVAAEYAAVYTTLVSGVITATVKANPPAPKPGQGSGEKSFENYQIGYYKNSDPTKTEIWDDPKIKMH
jgi:hypothetical protein